MTGDLIILPDTTSLKKNVTPARLLEGIVIEKNPNVVIVNYIAFKSLEGIILQNEVDILKNKS